MKLLSRMKYEYKKIKHYRKIRRSPSYYMDYTLRYGTTKYIGYEKESYF